jgi:hypothetical protein
MGADSTSPRDSHAEEHLLRARLGCEEALQNPDQMKAVEEFARSHHKN